MLQHIDAILNALGNAPAPPRTPDGAVGAFWSVNLPLKHLPVDPIAALFTYAAAQSFPLDFAAGLVRGFARIVPPLLPTPESLGVPLRFESAHMGASLDKTIYPEYPSPALRDLCLGEWAKFGRLQLRADPGHLCPAISTDGSIVQIRWRIPIAAELAPAGLLSRVFRRVSRTDLHGLDITRMGARLIAFGATRFLLPDILWT